MEEKAIEYLEEKIASLKEKIAQYESPIMSESMKNNPGFQLEYTRMVISQQAHEDILFMIKKFG